MSSEAVNILFLQRCVLTGGGGGGPRVSRSLAWEWAPKPAAKPPTYAHMCAHMCTYAHICEHMHTCVQICAHMHTYAHMCTHMRTYAHLCTHMCTCALFCIWNLVLSYFDGLMTSAPNPSKNTLPIRIIPNTVPLLVPNMYDSHFIIRTTIIVCSTT